MINKRYNLITIILILIKKFIILKFKIKYYAKII